MPEETTSKDFVYRKEVEDSEWTQFNDSLVEHKGNWFKVVNECISSGCYPTTLLFEK